MLSAEETKPLFPLESDRLLVTAREAARLLSIGERTLARLTAAGDIPVTRLTAKSIRYNVQYLRDFIASRTNKEAGSA